MCKQLVVLVLVLGFCAGSALNAATIVWVSDNADNDAGWVEWLEGQGFTVEWESQYWRDLTQEKVDMLNAADLVIVGRGIADSREYDDNDEIAQWNSVTSPMILMHPWLSRNSRWQWFDHGGTATVNDAPALRVVETGHSIFLGVELDASSQVKPYAEGNIFVPSGDAGNGTVIARMPSGEPAIIEWAPGTQFHPNTTYIATARRMFFGAGDNNPAGAFNLSPVGEQIFINAVRYMLGLDLYAASTPSPRGVSLLRDVTLSWLPGPTMTMHDVYFGTDAAAVAAATRQDPQGVLLQQNHNAATYSVGKLQYGQTYYWRVDEVQGTTIHAGEVWTFTVDTYTHALPADLITVTASVPTGEGAGDPNVLLDGAGLDASDLHSGEPNEMWLGFPGAGESVMLTFAFDRVYKLANVDIWNYNHEVEFILGFGMKDITIDMSSDGETWTPVGDFTLAGNKVPGGAPCAAQTLDLGGISTQYIRITAHNTQSGNANAGLSEVRFQHVPVRANRPDPVAGSEDVSPSVVLSWIPGRETMSSQVHIGQDPAAVAAGQALVGMVSSPSYDTYGLNLMLDEKYYWMITEVNTAEAVTSWESTIWDFNTPPFLVIDDMESYDDDQNRIYYSWIDGLDDPSNGGSQSAPDDPPYASQGIVHSGSQAMFFKYGRSGATVSEVDLALPSMQNWKRSGITTLVIWFRGTAGNATPQLYAKINSTTINYTGSSSSLAAPVWKQWNIDLASVAAASGVTSVSLGVSGAGQGTLYFDDIRLYKDAAPQTGGATDPGTNGLMAYYPMNDSLADASGHGYGGAAQTGSSFGAGPINFGRALVLDGSSGHATLPIGPLVQSLTNATFAAWVNWAGSGSQWCRVFDFGTGTDNYMFLTPYSGSNDLRFAIRTPAVGEQITDAPGGILSAGWHHVAVTFDAATMTLGLYLDGGLVDTSATTLLPQDLGNTNQNYLGKSQWDDPYLPGSLDEFTIYNRVLTDAELRYLVGDR